MTELFTAILFNGFLDDAVLGLIHKSIENRTKADHGRGIFEQMGFIH